MSASDFDLVIRGGTVVDGTGLPGRRVDVGIREGRVARLAHLGGARGDDEIDAGGMVVAPGIVDVHTHYDAQVTFDPLLTMSCFQGVTTVVAGNCGFSAAPCRPQDRSFLAGVFASVENMDPVALGAVTWDEFVTFEEFLATRRGRLGINFGCYVGHSNLRRWTMGDDASHREATAAETAEMRRLLAEGLAAGAAGLSSSSIPTHLDGDGRPVPSRLAGHEELLELSDEAGRFGAGSISYLPASMVHGMTRGDEDLVIAMGRRSGLPVVIQGIGGRNKVDAPTATWEAAVDFFDRAGREGASVYSLLVTRPFDKLVTMDERNFHYMSSPAWDRMLHLPVDERRAMLRDAAARDELRFSVENYNRDPSKGTMLPPPLWSALYVDSVSRPQHRRFQGRSVEHIAAELDKTPADALLDISLEADFDIELRWQTETPEWTDAVWTAQRDPRMIVGISDGGAHLAKDDGSDWSSYFLRHWVIDRRVWSLEEGIRQVTAVPAAICGMHDRGTLRVGGWADVMIFDPATIGPLRKEWAYDFPGGSGRFKALSSGITTTIVNGVPVVRDGALVDALPGHVVSPR